MSGIPVKIATNGLGIPVKAVTSGAPAMQVSDSGIPIVLSDRGQSFVVNGGGPPPLPTADSTTVTADSTAYTGDRTI